MTFAGFPPGTIRFLSELALNNDKEWFERHRERYHTEVRDPAVAFVAEVGSRLQEHDPDLQVDLRANGAGSLMRIHRDTRFSADKSPYKSNVSGMWWLGEGKKTTSPAYGFQVEPDRMRLMGGMFGFLPDALAAYRTAVDGPLTGPALESIVASLRADGYKVVGEHYRRVPRGLPADHPRAELLRFRALYATPALDLGPGDIEAPDLVDIVVARLIPTRPLVRWLNDALT
ncbi:MAG: DUF2461 domain-containing protein [Propioniciclava sp.]